LWVPLLHGRHALNPDGNAATHVFWLHRKHEPLASLAA
jgi:hypothetical protein